MRILILNYEYPPIGGGGSSVSHELAKAYVQMGNEVDVVTMHYKNLPFFETKDGINIYRVKSWRSKQTICHPWEQLTYIISAKSFLKKHLKNNKYAVNHTHFIVPTGIISLWLKTKYKIPYIITTHGSDVLNYNKNRIFKYLYPLIKKQWREILSNATTIISPSLYLKNRIQKIYPNKDIKVIPNGIDPGKFKILKKQNKILIVTRLFKNKGVQDILDSIKNIDLKDWTVDIVGDGPYRKLLEDKSQKNNLSDRVKFHGWIEKDSQQLAKMYGQSKIFISASYFENISLVILEALSSGCKVIASNAGGNPEIVDKQNLFESKNIKELQEKIKREIYLPTLDNPKLNEKFYWPNIAKAYLEIIKNV